MSQSGCQAEHRTQNKTPGPRAYIVINRQAEHDKHHHFQPDLRHADQAAELGRVRAEVRHACKSLERPQRSFTNRWPSYFRNGTRKVNEGSAERAKCAGSVQKARPWLWLCLSSDG